MLAVPRRETPDGILCIGISMKKHAAHPGDVLLLSFVEENKCITD
jgi:hypothetical protein